MTSTFKDLFSSQGCLPLRGFHSRARLAALRQQVQDEAKRSSSNASASRSLRKLPVFQQIGRLSALVKVRDLHHTLMTPELLDLVAEVGGQRPSTLQDTQLLLSPPHQGPWTLDGLNWHVDIAAAGGSDGVPGVQAFFLIDDVSPRGGATLALSGSHRRHPKTSGAPSPLREVLKTSKDLARDLEAFGVSLVEMSGQAGDVFLMDMRVLHTPSINSTRHLRMMATCRCLIGP